MILELRWVKAAQQGTDKKLSTASVLASLMLQAKYKPPLTSRTWPVT